MLRPINYHICFSALSKQQHSIFSVLLKERGELRITIYSRLNNYHLIRFANAKMFLKQQNTIHFKKNLTFEGIGDDMSHDNVAL